MASTNRSPSPTLTPRVRALAALLDARSHGAFSREFAEIDRSQWLEPGELRELQLVRLAALVRHAAATVPFYARRFADQGLDPSAIRTPSDFARIPPLDKHEVVEHADEMLSQAGRPAMLTKKATGGSTGERMVFYRDAEAMARNFAHLLRNHTWTGLRLGDPHVLLWGAHFDLRAQQRFSNRIINFCLRQRWLDAFHMNGASMARYVGALRKRPPYLLSSYVTAATTLADFVLSETGGPLAIPAIATTAEVLFPAHRERLRAAFGGAVFDRLGCREIGNTAHECNAHDGLHVNAEHVYVEVVNEDGQAVAPGVEGDLLYTSLGNWRFPLIRYRVGDRAVRSDDAMCDCGRGLPKLAGVRGRVSDMLVTSDGTRVHGEYFSHLFYSLASVREFRVVQESLGQVRIWIRPRNGERAIPPADEASLRSDFRRLFGTHVDLDITVVDEIPKSPSGKHRFTEFRAGVQPR